jgi:hypothetical protein
VPFSSRFDVSRYLGSFGVGLEPFNLALGIQASLLVLLYPYGIAAKLFSSKKERYSMQSP